jgi:RimJ/RimL family protein N-acetyltransferase
MAFGWHGELVRLVPIDMDRHLENCIEWMNDPEVTAWLLVGDHPMTRIAEIEYLERMSKGDPKHVAFAIETLAGEHIGMSGIHDIDYRHGTAITGTIIGEKARWGHGYGTDAAKVRARYCFEVLGLRMLYSAVFVGNDRSLRMQEKAGYLQWGVAPKRYWKRGAFRDEIMTYLSRENWEKLVASDAASENP